MGDFFELMAAPFVACLVLTGIHAYLGLHVVQRGVIFVDLALAQVAALGATFGFLLGFGLHSLEGYFIALLMTVIAAVILAFSRGEGSSVPQEAYIGIVYVVAAGASIVVLSSAPQGGEELKSLLVGHLLFVGWDEITKVLAIYSGVALLHWFIRYPLIAISLDHEKAKTDGLNVKWLDFVFYATFGIVATSSVELAGVLLVFSFLIVPAVCAALLSDCPRTKLLIGWFVGFVTSIAGITASYFLDLPTGATIVCTFGLCAPICLLLKRRKG